MQTLATGSVDAAQLAGVQKMLALQSQMKSGIGWFYWIGGMSLLNSVIYRTGSSLTFVIGLGTTQVVDAITTVIADEFISGLSTIVYIAGFVLDALFAGFFLLCGVLGRKRYRWVVVIGMVFYALDGIIFVLVGEWLGALFHLLGLWGLWNGLKAINGMAALEKRQAAGSPAA